MNAFLLLKGKQQGDIRGSVMQKGREGSILVHAYANQIVSPRDPVSGLPTGKRQHLPLSIRKEVDRSSPLLWNALVNNEILVAWTLNFWGSDVASPLAEKLVYAVSLTNASIASIREFLPDNDDPATSKLTLMQEITFTYQKIQWTWTEGGLTAQDTWETPAV